jgi:predicted enzyme related to lactoylglutathione lyase
MRFASPPRGLLLPGRCQQAPARKNFRDAAAILRPNRKDEAMKFASTRLIVADIKAVVGFYEKVTGQKAEWLAPVFAEIVTPAATLAFGSAETVVLFKEGSAEPAANRTAIIEFQVDDVEAEFARLRDEVEVVHAPKMMPWGNRAAQFRDPEGTLVGMYTPVTDAAKQRFGSR